MLAQVDEVLELSDDVGQPGVGKGRGQDGKQVAEHQRVQLGGFVVEEVALVFQPLAQSLATLFHLLVDFVQTLVEPSQSRQLLANAPLLLVREDGAQRPGVHRAVPRDRHLTRRHFVLPTQIQLQVPTTV